MLINSPADFRRRLLRWFRVNRRDLPWRHTNDPYAIWVSEIMLQQTQVATVRGYYLRFLERFPTIEALAGAEEHDVLRLWEGLGYYRRARQMQAAARRIVVEYGGRFPRDPSAAACLPGLGRYTVGAVLSIAYDQRLPILEANTVRLWARLLAHRRDPRSTAAQRRFWQAAEAVLPTRGSGELNQALMELGSLVCVPRQPRCGQCPVARHCAAFIAGLQHKIPRPKPKPLLEHCRETAVVVRRRGRVLLRQRGPGERWSGLWDFPRLPSPLDSTAWAAATAAATGVRISRVRPLTTIRHTVTRFRITLDCLEAEGTLGRQKTKVEGAFAWAPLAHLGEYALTRPARRIAELLEPA